MTDSKRGEMKEALRRLLLEGFSGTQEEICNTLNEKGFKVNQSTVSRALRKLGAVKSMGADGVVYRMPKEMSEATYTGSIGNLVLSIDHNEAMIVMRTVSGSASFVGEFLDHSDVDGILGTIAGDDTLFIAVRAVGEIDKVQAELERAMR